MASESGESRESTTGPLGNFLFFTSKTNDINSLSLNEKVKVSVAQVCRLFVIPWTVAHQAPLSKGFSRQGRILEWFAISFPKGSFRPRDRTWSPALQADCLPTELQLFSDISMGQRIPKALLFTLFLEGIFFFRKYF